MKNLSDILYKCDLIEINGDSNIEISNINFDSRKVNSGDMFAAIRGLNNDGHTFINHVIERGAVAIVCEDIPKNPDEKITWVKVKDSSKALGYIASNFYDNPSNILKVIGVTGTNGKTTITSLLHRLMTDAGINAGLISTIETIIGDRRQPSSFTTPDALELNKVFSEMINQKCDYCFMEVSSHAINQNRIEGVRFEGAVFTNITHDHLDYHKSFDNYLKTKKRFFDNLDKNAFALTNIDDKNGKVMLQNTSAKKYTYSLKNIANFKGKVVENLISGLQMEIDGNEIWCKLASEYNAYNLLAIYGTAVLLGLEKQETLRLLSNLESVEGRFDYFVNDDKVMAIVDYAHTPDALENVLSGITKLRTCQEKLITVIGCGGNRDATKRPLMAQIAARLSDRIILTSDNPRFEDPETIIKQMEDGLDPIARKKSVSITNRYQAIKTACAMADSGDIILVAGKGHEKYQDIMGKKKPFDDKKILKEFLL